MAHYLGNYGTREYLAHHWGGGDIINIGSNNTYNFGCNGGHRGSFWGGFGLALGNALGGLFTGGTGSFGMMGGFPMMGGFNMMGGSIWGNTPWMTQTSPAQRVERNAKSSDNSSSDSSRIGRKNGDYKKLNKLFERKNDILAQANPKLEDLKKLKENIASLKDNLDGNDDSNDKDYIKQLERGLDEAIKKAEGNANQNATPKVEEPPKADGSVNPALSGTSTDANSGANSGASPVAVVAPVADPVTPVAEADDLGSITLNGQPIKLADLTIDQIKALTPAQIEGLEPKQAKGLLEKLGLLSADKNTVKATTNLNALLLASKSDLPLACGHNTKLDNVEGADAYLKGKISDVTLDESTKIISFVIEDDNVKIKMSCQADSNKYQIAEMIERKTDKYSSVKKGTEYTISENSDYAVRNGEAAIKKNKKN